MIYFFLIGLIISSLPHKSVDDVEILVLDLPLLDVDVDLDDLAVADGDEDRAVLILSRGNE